MVTTMAAEANLSFDRAADGTLLLRLSGPWHLLAGVPSVDLVDRELSSATPKRLGFDASALSEWDTGVLTFVTRVGEICKGRSIAVDRSGLPQGVQDLLGLAETVPEKTDARAAGKTPPLLARIGDAALATRDGFMEMLTFVGTATVAFWHLVTRRARFRTADLLVLVQQAGAEALPIVTLISFLVGLILAFVGAVQLTRFGASIYVADLVGIAMVREMGAMMTGIVMAGRTGASYAAQLGTMKVTQEIDALETMGISPFEFLVLPRMLALFLMMPLLCLYADALGILGGATVGIGMLGLSPKLFFDHVFAAVTLGDVVGGVFKASVYGVLIALSGCLRGMQASGGSSAVGDVTTSAVVTSIVLIIGACGLFAVLFYILGI